LLQGNFNRMSHSQKTDALRNDLKRAIEHLEHVLPGQFPLKDFVHHNTIHGYQHLHFSEALDETHKVTDIFGYQPIDSYRQYLKQGRIKLEHLEQVILNDEELESDKTIAVIDGRDIKRLEIYSLALRYSFDAITKSQLKWKTAEENVFEKIQSDVPEVIKEKLLDSDLEHTEADIVSDLWCVCLEAQNLEDYLLHPEELMDLSSDQAESIFTSYMQSEKNEELVADKVRDRMRRDIKALIRLLLKKVGNELSIRGFLLAMTGEDIMDDIRPVLIRHLSNHLDHGMASWHNAKRSEGFFSSWLLAARTDLSWFFDEIPDWHEVLEGIPDNALDAIIIELRIIGIPKSRWNTYLQRLALELPGWSGMFMWRHVRQGYEDLDAKIDMADYLAVRLVLERLFAQKLMRQIWNIAPNLDVIKWYFNNNEEEFLVRYSLFNLRLPEYIVSKVHLLMRQMDHNKPQPEEWKGYSNLIWTWLQSPAAENSRGKNAYREGWRLFLLSQHLGLNAEQICDLDASQITEMLSCLEKLTVNKSGFLWLQAYEMNYRQNLFEAVTQNHGRGRWSSRDETVPEVQITFCMDDREEGVRRHLEEHNPAIETLGAAGFFGVAINWVALDDKKPTALCPVVVTPAHQLHEKNRAENSALNELHTQRVALKTQLKNYFFNDTRLTIVKSFFGVCLAAPLGLSALLLKVFLPLKSEELMHKLSNNFEPPVPTTLELNAVDDECEATIENNRNGFTDKEQADRVQNFLKTIGLIKGFAPLVVMMGHGATTSNNPHQAAYDCGACSGKHGGPNARAFTAMANRPIIRKMLKKRGIDIPESTWFVGAEHITSDEKFVWYDTDKIPSEFSANLKKLQQDLKVATLRSAHERCRKLLSAPLNLDKENAYRHVQTRSADISQVIPEYGHTTNAAAFIGRRSLSQGAFFDRRVFLISYDPTTDAQGKIVENILLNAGPVGAGINLEYYFSTVNNDLYGCSSKITHNVTGHYGIMDGTESDLRTGLPYQMIGIHEAMRLQVLVEAKIDTLTKIYQRQPALQELVGNGWLLLSAKDPESETIHTFDPKKGWVLWESDVATVQTFGKSSDWYRGHRDHLPPVLIKQPEVAL